MVFRFPSHLDILRGIPPAILGILDIAYLVFLWFFSYFYLLFRKIYPAEMKSLDDEIILITGSGNGIGREIALKLAKTSNNAVLVLWDIDEELNKKTASDVQDLGCKCYCYTVDVSDRIAVEETAEIVKNEVGDVTVLINNAGIAGYGTILDQDPIILEKTVKINFTAHFWTLRAFLPKMIEKNYGHIVTMCSMAAYATCRFGAPYAATKYAVRGYLKSLESEIRTMLNPCNVKFTTIYPYFANTTMTNRIILKMKLTDWNNMVTPTQIARLAVLGIQRNEEKVFVPQDKEMILMWFNVCSNLFLNALEDWMAQDTSYRHEDGTVHQIRR